MTNSVRCCRAMGTFNADIYVSLSLRYWLWMLVHPVHARTAHIPNVTLVSVSVFVWLSLEGFKIWAKSVHWLEQILTRYGYDIFIDLGIFEKYWNPNSKRQICCILLMMVQAFCLDYFGWVYFKSSYLVSGGLMDFISLGL